MDIAVDRVLGFFRGRARLWLGALVAAAALSSASFWLGRESVPAPPTAIDASETDSYADDTSVAPSQPAANATASRSPARRAHADEPEGAAVIAAATHTSGLRYVHRMNSDLRAAPSYGSQVLKKEPKGAQVQLVALSDKWAQVRDGAVTGWMRASVLKDTPPDAPGTKKRSRKKEDGG